MLLQLGHRFEPHGNWAIFEVVEINGADIKCRIGPSVCDEVWQTVADHIHVTMSLWELQRLLDAHLFSFDDPDFAWDDPEATGKLIRYPKLEVPGVATERPNITAPGAENYIRKLKTRYGMSDALNQIKPGAYAARMLTEFDSGDESD